MSITLSPGIIMAGLAGVSICSVRVAANQTQNVRINYMSCCIEAISLCIAQYADKTFSFTDRSGADFSTATEITFTIWEDANSGALVLNKTLSGADIILASPSTFQLEVTSTESGAMTTTRKYCEAWVTASGGDRSMVGAGTFDVKDTRKFG